MLASSTSSFSGCSPLLGMRHMRHLPRIARTARLNTARCSSAAPAVASSALPRVVLKGGKSRLFSDLGNPTVYSGAIDRVVGRPGPQAGDPVLVCDGSEAPIAWGMFNPASMYRVRILQTLEDVSAEALAAANPAAILTARIKRAVALRASLSLPSTATSVYRLINSEGDRLSGLVVDVLGHVAVAQSSAVWVEQRRPLIESLLKEVTAGVTEIVWRRTSELTAEEGWPAEEAAAEAGATAGSEIAAAPVMEEKVAAQQVEVVEGGLKLLVDPYGQKTGFYADQREHRGYIRTLAAGKDVLDVCCYSGGFALNAALGGATSVLGVDSSVAALNLARQNAELNGMTDRCAFEKADAAEFMRRVGAEGRKFDIIVLDPPKLAPSRKSLQNALRKYEALNAAALRLIGPEGGLLMTCSCSGAVAQGKDFLPMLQRAAKRAKRRVSVVRSGGAAADHPLDPGYPEGQYLTNVILSVS